jgi:hypothetical protein
MEGSLAFESEGKAWSVAEARDAARERLSLVNPQGTVLGYVSFRGDGDRLSMELYHRAGANFFPGKLMFDGKVSMREDSFACRTIPVPGEQVLNFADGAGDSALNDSIFAREEDLALRFFSPETAVRTIGGGKYRVSLKADIDDPALATLWDAAVATFAQNAVDVFSDCPGRERAGWLCDSFFTARVSWLFTGSNEMETLFLENFALPERFENIADGMLPMCWPADHLDENFIPNWAMWFVLQLDEYARERKGDAALVAKLRPRVEKLVRFFEAYENADGLLEKLPAWVFVEWSKANTFVQDVNYPSNMAYAGMLDAVARLYGRADLAAKAARVRRTVKEQSFDGRFFRDHAVRAADGRLEVRPDVTETCQYYAFYFGVASFETDGALWRRLLDDCGPVRKVLERYPDVGPSNAFIGNYLRLELLSRAGLPERIDRESRGFFTYMAERTGTLWEHDSHDSTAASCCHGFAAHVAVLIDRDLKKMKAP